MSRTRPRRSTAPVFQANRAVYRPCLRRGIVTPTIVDVTPTVCAR